MSSDNDMIEQFFFGSESSNLRFLAKKKDEFFGGDNLSS